jgi:hypothetical protein
MIKKNLIYTVVILQFLVHSCAISQNIKPVKNNDSKYSFSFANLYFEVDASIGGRVSSFKLDSSEILNFDTKYLLQSGSTFWPGPQSAWGWPPIAVLDHKPYEAVIAKNELKLTSDVTSDNLRVVKIFSANLQDSSISIKYIMKNTGKKDISWAPWEITRVKPSGVTFFEKGEGDVTGDMSVNTSEISRIVWYDQNTSTPSFTKKKFFSDGKGWLAHATTDNVLFIKKFADISLKEAAPAESEIEVYTNPQKLFTELENLGAYVTINPEDSVVWEVKWFARKIPKKVAVEVGSKELIMVTNKIIGCNSDANGTFLKKNKK